MKNHHNSSLFCLFIISCLLAATVMIAVNRDEIAAAQAAMRSHYALNLEF